MQNQLAHEKYNYSPNLQKDKNQEYNYYPDFRTINTPNTSEKKLTFKTALFWTLVTPILIIIFLLTPFILFYGGLSLVGDYPLIHYLSSDTQWLIATHLPHLYPYLR